MAGLALLLVWWGCKTFVPSPRGGAAMDEPIQISVRVRNQGRRVLFNPVVTGANGKSYSTLVYPDGRLAPAPTLIVRDDADTIVHRGRFSYG